MLTSTLPSLPDGRESGAVGCIVVLAKCPLPGTSKTRLIPLLGADGAAALAKAMLSDVLVALSQLMVPKILFYAPGSVNGWNHMNGMLQELRLLKGWKLVPMEDSNTTSSLTSTDLGSKLTRALCEARTSCSGTGGVVFVGMDSPELPLDEIEHSLHQAAHNNNTALLCPAHDGGYGMLCVPHCAPPTIFQGIKWSHPHTAFSQLKALTDAGVSVTIGRLMYDIDDANDVYMLADRLVHPSQCSSDRLLQSSSGQAPRTSDCKYTWDALLAQGIIVSDDSGKHHINVTLPSSGTVSFPN